MRSTSLAPAGFFTSRIETGLPATGIVSTRPKAPPNPSSAVRTRFERGAQVEREGRGGHSVVDVVEPGQRQAQLDGARRGGERHVGPAHAVEPHALGDHGRLGACAAAVGAVVAAEVAEVDGVVDVGRAAVAAVLGVGRVLELGQRLRVVGHAEVHDPLALAAEVGDERVVGVQHEAGAAGMARRPAPPTRRPAAPARRSGRAGRGRGSRAGTRAGCTASATRGSHASSTSNRPSWPRLAARVQQRRGHAPAHVRAGAVVHHPLARSLEDRGDHRRRRGLAVGGRTRARRRGPGAPDIRSSAPVVGAEQQPARKRRAAAAAQAARERAHGAREGLQDPAHAGGAITRRQRGRTVIRAGVAPIGSPSA